MKSIERYIAILLAMVVVVLATCSLRENNKSKEANVALSQEEVVLHTIMSRSSVRKYTTQQIKQEKIKTILKAGMAAPTAGNRQPWAFYVVTDTAIIKQFTQVTKYAAPMNEQAKTAIIVCGNPSKSFPEQPEYWVQDCSAASENILLAAHGMGLGAVWCGVYPGVERVATLKQLLNIPSELVPLNIIMLGYPDASPSIKEKWNPQRVHYVK